ncbi:hypothetical protein [Gloeobacter kilaueensis]|uniref:Uncharacterized protein n=1 Tax=Gloeobacter kilaueensis (strain ATCC BAA-2537 / CCAP 1431/1 / ULC 316 / JS1) TaxID=1183438 RepID=U5QC86_GLOK1|nr:hypothetical protein [Gloeobacter kilaueensis]AGY56471.1 hypothetical protein GKIL_0224 [Gloeobacter kilaueensis JS1]
MAETPWWLEEWCRQNGYSEPCWVDEPDQVLGGRWWAFPPQGVMPLPVDPLGIGEAFKTIDRVMDSFEQGVDEVLGQVDLHFSPIVEQIEDTCESVFKAWGLDRIFVDDE